MIDEHLANAMRLAADLRVEMEAITNGVCVNKYGIIISDPKERTEVCDNLDDIIGVIGRLAGLLMAEAVFNDTKKQTAASNAKLTEKQKKCLREY